MIRVCLVIVVVFLYSFIYNFGLMYLQGECGEEGTGPQPGHHPEGRGAREQLRREDHPVGKYFLVGHQLF